MTKRRLEITFFGIVLVLCGAVSHSSWEPPHRFWPKPVIDLVPRHPWIALTFDDGPHPIMTERLLNVLKEEGIPATFFVVGKMAARYPRIVQEMARQGHEVANHTFNHHNIVSVDDKTLLNELGQTRSLIRKLTGRDTLLYRPPGGDFSKRSLKVARQAGYHMVLWTVLTRDVNGATISAMRRRIFNGAADGAIVLMHSGIPNTLHMLPDLIDDLRLQGYHFVTVSQLLGYDHSSGVSKPLPIPDAPINPVVRPPAASSRSYRLPVSEL